MANTILVVDDEKNIVALVRRDLGNEGFHVEEAYDGKQALEKARSVSPDLIVLDVMMPEMDGLTVCKEIRKTSSPSIPGSIRSSTIKCGWLTRACCSAARPSVAVSTT